MQTGDRWHKIPQGQQRYTRGAALPTELKFTGQREEAMLGLYDYGARWYDPALGRFISPDTLIPDPGNPADWDRYAYTRGNPIKYTDPSGHMLKNPEDGGLPKQAVSNQLKKLYNWEIQDLEKWNTTQLFEVWRAALTIQDYIGDIKGEDVNQRIRNYLGGTDFYLGGWNEKLLRSAVGPNAHEVRLVNNFENIRFQTKNTTGMIIHELGHVLDNRLTPNNVVFPAVIGGGGPADALIRFIGGNPTVPLRFWGITNIPLKSRFADYGYGNNSSADYFAQTFAVLMVDNGKEPYISGLWMQTFLKMLP